MHDFHNNMSIWLRMEGIKDTQEPDPREVEPFGQALQHDLVIYTNRYTCGMEE